MPEKGLDEVAARNAKLIAAFVHQPPTTEKARQLAAFLAVSSVSIVALARQKQLVIFMHA